MNIWKYFSKSFFFFCTAVKLSRWPVAVNMDTELLLTSTPSERLQQETSVLRVLICSLFYTSLFIFYRLTGPYSYSLVHLSTHTPHPKLTSSRRWNWTLFFLPHANVRKKSKGWLTLCLSVGCRSIWLYCAGDYLKGMSWAFYLTDI